MKDRLPQKMIDDARELYLQYGGRQHSRIEEEMRSKGWSFYWQMLYHTSHAYGVTQGWPERFGWLELLSDEARLGLKKKNADRNKFESWLADTFPTMNWSWKYQRQMQ